MSKMSIAGTESTRTSEQVAYWQAMSGLSTVDIRNLLWEVPRKPSRPARHHLQQQPYPPFPGHAWHNRSDILGDSSVF
ncbi:hypothetical protein ACOMHN_048085 [Nucella lapillus]